MRWGGMSVTASLPLGVIYNSTPLHHTTPHHTTLKTHLVLAEGLQQDVCPVALIRELAEVRQRLLGAADLPFLLRKFVRQGDEELAVTLALERREGEDAREVEVVGAVKGF